MEKTLEFPRLLRLIDERSTAFGAALASAPSLDAQVPTCPEWALLDLAEHLGNGQRKWAVAVTAGPAATPPAEFALDGLAPAPREREALLAWWAESTTRLLSALRETGPDRGCWTWWGDSQSPQTSGAVARHRVQEVAVHTYDAQLTAGTPQPLPDEVALDGVDEFQSTCVATTVAWPHKPAVVDHHTVDGHSWRLRLSVDGARTVRAPFIAADSDPAEVSVRGTASELVLTFYGRFPVDSLQLDGDRRIYDQLVDWDPSQ